MIDTLQLGGESYLEKAKLILLISLIAVARKLSDMDMQYADYAFNFSLAAIILSLTLGYYFLQKPSRVD